MALIGPATSGGVVAAGPTFTGAKLAAISPSATRSSLTKGNDRIGGFWRVVPDDSVQGPSDARFMISKGAKKVVIIDDQEVYSTGLADAAGGTLKAKGVEVTRLSVSQSVTDFSSLVTKVPGDADFVFLARDTATPYLDTRPLLAAGKPEIREYKAMFVLNDEEIGIFSHELVVNCAP